MKLRDAMVCPNCKEIFIAQSECPTCRNQNIKFIIQYFGYEYQAPSVAKINLANLPIIEEQCKT